MTQIGFPRKLTLAWRLVFKRVIRKFWYQHLPKGRKESGLGRGSSEAPVLSRRRLHPLYAEF